MSQKDNLTTVLDQAIRNRMAELQTAMPAQVVSYDYKKQKASVQPTINRKYKDGQVSPYPVISNVPVIFPRSGGASMTFPVKAGDTVLLIFTSRSLDDWLQRGGKVDQSDTRMHSINDAVAIPGLIPFSANSKAKNNDDVLITYAGSEVEIKKGGQINLQSPVKVYVDSPLLHASGDIYADGDITAKEEIYDKDRLYGSHDEQRIKYNTHIHNENDNGGPTDPPQAPYLWD